VSERNPYKGYREQQPGEHPGQFEADAQTWRVPVRQLVQYVDQYSGRDPTDGRVVVECTKPDARVNLRLTIGFRPEADANHAWDDLDWMCFDMRRLRQHLTDTRIWLAECDSYGAGLRECGDLVGTQVAPVQMVADGNWGAIYEVDVDCKAVRARIDFYAMGVNGRWLATAKWVAVSMMSDRDWLHARERMQLTVNPQLGPLANNPGPG
jgi:hypothetical protein